MRDGLIDAVTDYYSAGQAQDAVSQYRFFWGAYMYALRGDKSSAIRDLQAAIDGGYRDLPAIIHLGFFDTILEEPEVVAVLEQLRTSNESELERLHAVVDELGPVW